MLVEGPSGPNMLIFSNKEPVPTVIPEHDQIGRNESTHAYARRLRLTAGPGWGKWGFDEARAEELARIEAAPAKPRTPLFPKP